ncbi:MAG TPA: PspA/IM30 family protein [Gemmataceae bacterium]|nr:PspA/IM30 family protein [Gemmataceae bacterium]
MGALEAFLLRLIFWVVVPILLLVLVIGPRRVQRGWRSFWNWLTVRRREPEEILAHVMRQHKERIEAVRKALAQSETAEADIARNISKSQDNVMTLEEEARSHAARGDDLGARAALYKLNLERLAVQSFQERLDRQRRHIAEARRRLYLLELQLRQYEVGRSILLSQLAEAKTVEQQYELANNFDPFSAVAHWREAEGMVHDRATTARAVEQVYTDVAEIPLTGQPAQIEPAALDAQLAELKASLAQGGNRNGSRTN